MSTVDPTTVSGLAPAGRARKRDVSSPWVWMALACVLLGSSGWVRGWQDHRFATAQKEGEEAPFSLRELPQTLGDWSLVEGGESNLDPEVAKIAGSKDHVIRTYRHAITGISLSVFVLFGPAEMVFGHRPEVCYPSAGYRMVAEPLLCEVAKGEGAAAVFCSEVFARERDKRQRREEVYYAFRHGGQWSPDVERFWKDFRHHPSMFKIQVQRPVSPLEHRELNNPTEQFLTLLLPEIESRIARTQGE